jgi:threonine/homoserine/homoserine lactone efflux protein
MLLTRRAKSNAPAFLVGWIVGLAVVGVIVLVISSGADVATYDERSTVASTVRALVGVLLLFLAWRQWQNRPEEGEETQMPRWMQRMESVNPAMALGLGALLSALNPKDTTLTIFAAVAIARAGLSAGESAVTLAVFVAIATISVGAPITLYFALGERAEETLNGWKAWLTENNATVMAVLFLVFGVVLVGQGIRGLAS